MYKIYTAFIKYLQNECSILCLIIKEGDVHILLYVPT